MSTLRPTVTEFTAGGWLLQLARRWFWEFLVFEEQQAGHPPNYWINLKAHEMANEFDKWPEDNVPGLLVVSPGLSERPRRNGDGTYDATWLFACALIVSAQNRTETREAAAAYARAFAHMVTVFRGLERPNNQASAAYVDEQYRDIRGEYSRTLRAATVYVEVTVHNIMDEGGTTPEPEPRANPYLPVDDPPVVESGRIRINLYKEIENP